MTQGRASTPEAEEWRREQIRFAVKQRAKARDSKGRFISTKDFLERSRREKGLTIRKGKIHVLLRAEYRIKGRSSYPHKLGWDYNYEDIPTYIDPNISSGNPSALNAHLNELHPNHVHYSSGVFEYL